MTGASPLPGLRQTGHSARGAGPLPRSDIDAAGVTGDVAEELRLRRTHFPREHRQHRFAHSLFEDIDFTPAGPRRLDGGKLQLSGFEEKWAPVLTEWFDGVLRTVSPGAEIALNQLSERDKQVEMAFYLPRRAAFGIRCAWMR